MSNPLYNMLGGNQYSGLIQQFQQFRKAFQGNPQQQVQQLLNSGRITQQQYDQAVQKANALRKMLGM